MNGRGCCGWDDDAVKSCMTMECPYHHKRWRGQLQRLLNGLRGKVLLDKHIRMFPKAVCVCKGQTTTTCRLEDIPKMQAWIESAKGGKELDTVRPVLVDFLSSASNDSHLNLEAREALVNVVALVKAAVACDYHFLEPLHKDTEQSESALFEEKFELALSSHCIGPFIGSGGKHLKALCTKYSVEIQLGSGSQQRRSRHQQYIFGSSVVVTLKHGRNVNTEAVKRELQKRAETVTQQREKHTQNVRAYRERKRVQRQARGTSTANTSVGIYQNPKEAATGQFEKKQHHQKSKANSSKPSFSALLHGHCLLCMAPYKAGETKEGACTYHGGYLVKSGRDKEAHWSCCKKQTEEQSATHELHSSTGCSSGRHIWRPGKADKGRVSSNTSASAGGKEDFYVQ